MGHEPQSPAWTSDFCMPIIQPIPATLLSGLLMGTPPELVLNIGFGHNRQWIAGLILPLQILVPISYGYSSIHVHGNHLRCTIVLICKDPFKAGSVNFSCWIRSLANDMQSPHRYIKTFGLVCIMLTQNTKYFPHSFLTLECSNSLYSWPFPGPHPEGMY